MTKKDMKFVDFKVQQVSAEDDNYFFDVVLIFPDGTELVQTKKGFESADEANAARDKAIGQLYSGQYVIDEELSVKDYMTHWLEDVKRKQITNNSYIAFANIVYKHIIPFFQGVDMKSIKMAHIQELYNEKTEFSPSIARNIKSVMNISLEYAKQNNYIERNISLLKMVLQSCSHLLKMFYLRMKKSSKI